METISQGTAVVTGATSGIGAAYAVELARRGWKLILTGRRATKLQDLARTLRERYGVEASVEIIELSDPGAVEALARRLEATPVDLLVNNAGFGHKALFQDSDYAPLEQMVAVHVSTPMRLTRAVLPGMVRRGRGGIIQVSSAAALLPHPGNTVYSATKAFLKTFAETLALDLAGTGVAVKAARAAAPGAPGRCRPGS